VFNAVADRFRVPLRWWRACGGLTQDAGVAVAFTVLALLPPLAANGLRLGQLPVHRAGPVAVVLVLAQGLPLVARRRWPALCLAVVACAFAAYQLLGYPPSFGGEGLLLALYAAGAHEGSFRGELITGATASYVVLAVALDGLGSPERAIDYVVFYLALAACWGAGAFVRGRRASGLEQHDQRAAGEPASPEPPLCQPSQSRS
jgi:hypothetical protein